MLVALRSGMDSQYGKVGTDVRQKRLSHKNPVVLNLNWSYQYEKV